MNLVTPDSEEIKLHALVEQARQNGWTLSWEQDTGNFVGLARRGKVMLSATAESVVAAIWAVLQKINRFPIGDAA
jgi:hypothetical protein